MWHRCFVIYRLCKQSSDLKIFKKKMLNNCNFLRIFSYCFIIFTAILLQIFYFNSNIFKDLLGLTSTIITTTTITNGGLLTKDELKLYNGIDKPQLYLSLLGNIFDVTSGKDHYGPDKSYNFFIGTDATRSFVTGEFHGDPRDDISDFTIEEFQQIDHWLKFYKKQYKFIGKLIGRYFNEDGSLTEYGRLIIKLLKNAENQQITAKKELEKFPSCNIEWNQDVGTHLWCTKNSGGVKRNWIGYPRQLYQPNTKNSRCACIQEEDLNIRNLKQYDGCDSEAHECFIKDL